MWPVTAVGRLCHIYIFDFVDMKKMKKEESEKECEEEKKEKRNEPVGDHVQDGSKLGGCRTEEGTQTFKKR
jgi:hypothetical protein